MPKDISYFRRERELALKKTLQVSNGLFHYNSEWDLLSWWKLLTRKTFVNKQLILLTVFTKKNIQHTAGPEKASPSEISDFCRGYHKSVPWFMMLKILTWNLRYNSITYESYQKLYVIFYHRHGLYEPSSLSCLLCFSGVQVAQSKSLVIQPDVMQRELESCLRREYTSENLPLLLLQVRVIEQFEKQIWNLVEMYEQNWLSGMSSGQGTIFSICMVCRIWLI